MLQKIDTENEKSNSYCQHSLKKEYKKKRQ